VKYNKTPKDTVFTSHAGQTLKMFNSYICSESNRFMLNATNIDIYIVRIK
jgi:hypothetical protein